MFSYSQKLISLLLHYLFFSLIGGYLFTVIADSELGLIPYIIAFGVGAGWQLTHPIGLIAMGSNGIIFTAFCFAVRLGIALIVGWLVLVPYGIYLVVQAARHI